MLDFSTSNVEDAEVEITLNQSEVQKLLFISNLHWRVILFLCDRAYAIHIHKEQKSRAQ